MGDEAEYLIDQMMDHDISFNLDVPKDRKLKSCNKCGKGQLVWQLNDKKQPWLHELDGTIHKCSAADEFKDFSDDGAK